MPHPLPLDDAELKERPTSWLIMQVARIGRVRVDSPVGQENARLMIEELDRRLPQGDR